MTSTDEYCIIIGDRIGLKLISFNYRARRPKEVNQALILSLFKFRFVVEFEFRDIKCWLIPQIQITYIFKFLRLVSQTINGVFFFFAI